MEVLRSPRLPLRISSLPAYSPQDNGCGNGGSRDVRVDGLRRLKEANQ